MPEDAPPGRYNSVTTSRLTGRLGVSVLSAQQALAFQYGID
jgi:hypothetical protein